MVNRVKSLYRNFYFSLRIIPIYWALITFGIVFVLGSLVFCFEIPASGSVLVFCSIFAELYFRSEEWIYISYKDSFLAESHLDPKEAHQNRRHQLHLYEYGGTYVQADFIYFLKARTVHLKQLSSDTSVAGKWSFNSSVSRLTSFISWVSAITASIGTVLWGYGHLVFH